MTSNLSGIKATARSGILQERALVELDQLVCIQLYHLMVMCLEASVLEFPKP